MIKALVHWAVPLVALLVIGPLAGMLTASLRASDGSGAATLLLNNSPAMGLLCGLGVVALAALAGVAATRLIGFRHGLFCAGLVLAWAAWGTTTVDAVIRRERSASALWILAVEAALLGLAGVALAFFLWRLAADRPPVEVSRSADEADKLGWLFGLVVCIVIGGIGAWLVARTTMKGQAVAAAVAAGTLGAMAGRLMAHRAHALVFVAAIAALGVAGPAVAAVLPGGGEGVVRAAYAGTLFPLGRSLPLDWLAGAFLGIPLGLSWAASMTEMKAVP